LAWRPTGAATGSYCRHTPFGATDRHLTRTTDNYRYTTDKPLRWAALRAESSQLTSLEQQIHGANSVTIYVDADACPVKAETLKVAERHGVNVIYVSDGGVRPMHNPLAQIVVVAQGADAADDWIVERIAPGDICVTGDIPLADRCLKAGATALRHNGEVFTQANIGNLLATRDLMADLRSANPLSQVGGGRAFSKADRSRFLEALERELRRV